MGTTRTSEPESLNIGTPFQMTLEAVGTPLARRRQPNNCFAGFPVCPSAAPLDSPLAFPAQDVSIAQSRV